MTLCPFPSWLIVDIDAIADNFLVARQKVGSKVGIYPVVKANGYGLGAVPIAKSLRKADGFCVAHVSEAEELRLAGIDQTIILLSGLTYGLEQKVIDLDLQPTLFNLKTAHRLNQRAVGGTPVKVYIKVDTGFVRLGFKPARIPEVLAEIAQMPGLEVVGLISHLACADLLDRPETSAQTAVWQQLLNQLNPAQTGQLSLANSAGLLGHAHTHYHWVRPGILLYGASPFFPGRKGADDHLKPAISWLSRIIQIAEVAANTPIGYGHTFVTKRPSRVATLAVGYADGYSRRLSNRGETLVAGLRAPIVGRVSMDLTTIDVTDIPKATEGSQVTLLGEDGGDLISLEELATWMETIPYEVLCRIGPRVQRIYQGR